VKKDLVEFLSTHPLCQGINLNEKEWKELTSAIEEEFLVGYLSNLIQAIEEIMGIDPNLEQKEILKIAAERIVKDLDAEAASIRLFDPKTLRMSSFGAYRLAEEERAVAIPFKESIAGRVVRENKCITVSSILKNPEYKNKEIVNKKGLNSLLAVPIRIPRFMELKDDLLGSLQIYYKEDNRRFNPLEVIHAELLARRVSYVLTKKKILNLQKLNTKKETIVNKIFVKLSNQEGIKLKDLFILLIPELGESLQVQSCSLFTVSRDQRFIRLEAPYPLDQTYHELGYTFTVSHHPYFQTVIHGSDEYGDHPFERIDPSYLLIKDPQQSRLTSPGIREFVEEHKIHSILLIPIKADATIRYLMMFYATDQRQYFTDEEIELLTFFGREIMKASRLEMLDDILHDFKNPAIAIAGFANRARKLIDSGNLEEVREKLASYMDILVRETNRLQDLSFSMSVEGRAEVLDLSRLVWKRWEVNQEAVIEMGRTLILMPPPELIPDLNVYCSIFGLERVLDNVLSNATRAIPEEGGTLSVRTYCEDVMACLEVRNSGVILQDKIDQIRRGEVKGRGLNIIYRFIQAHHGKIDFRTESRQTVCTVKIPLH
jgi:signal transduction histidine kinase